MCSTHSLPCQKVPIVHLYVMNLNILPGDQDKKCTVIKHYMFDDDVPARIAKQIIRGTCFMLDYGSNKKAGAKPFMYLMQRMGGYTATFCKLELKNAQAKRKRLESPEDIDAAYDFIALKCPRGNDKNQQARWIDKELSNPESPIFTWTLGRIQNAVRNLKEAGSHADNQEDYPLYWGHLEKWFQDIMVRLIPRLDTETLLFLGCPRAGKSQTQMIFGFAMSRVRIWQAGEEGSTVPSVRTAPDFDCFKNEPGRPTRSTLFDDGDFTRMPPRKTKAFHNAKAASGMSVERYTSVKFVALEFRTSADNKVDLDAEVHVLDANGKKQPKTEGYTGTSYAEFLDMIKPAFYEGSTAADIEAVLSRVPSMFMRVRLLVDVSLCLCC